MANSNEWSNNNKGAVHTRAPICNILVVAYKYRDSLPFKAMNNYKRKGKQNQKVHTKFHPKTTLESNPLSKLLSDLIIGRFLANTTPVYSFPSLHLIAGFTLATYSTHFIHRQRRGTQLLTFYIIIIYIKTRISLNKTKCNYII